MQRITAEWLESLISWEIWITYIRGSYFKRKYHVKVILKNHLNTIKWGEGWLSEIIIIFLQFLKYLFYIASVLKNSLGSFCMANLTIWFSLAIKQNEILENVYKKIKIPTLIKKLNIIYKNNKRFKWHFPSLGANEIICTLPQSYI